MPGSRGTIVFAHANGFPAGCYRPLFDVWRAAGWQVLAPERFGHDPRYPVRSGWRPTRDELIAFIEREWPAPRRGALHLVGHSLGGYVALLAACRRPDLAASVVLIDSPLLGGWKAGTVGLAKATGLMGRISPGRVSRQRRDHWGSRDEARAHFLSKRVFARWAPAVLDEYIAAGLADVPEGGVTLAFHRDVETLFYNTVPHHFDVLLRRHPPRAPVSFIGGTRSAEVRQVGLALTQRVCRDRLQWIEGSHLFPMEHPQEAARAVLQALGAMR